MTRVRIATALVFAGSALMPAVSVAEGGTYDVLFCHELHRGFGGTIEATNSFSARTLCSDPQNSSAVQIESVDRTTEGRSGKAFWRVGEPLGITGVEVEGRLRRANGYRSELFMADGDGRSTHQVALGDSTSNGFQTYEWQGKPQPEFVASLQCVQSPSCPASDTAKTWVRSLRLTVADAADPEVAARGSLFDPGWIRGDVDVGVQGSDEGSGTAAVVVRANSSSILSVSGACDGEIALGVSEAFVPCEQSAEGLTTVATTESPFTNGQNEAESCVSDFAANTTCETHVVRIDNELPMTSFLPQDEQDPEQIRLTVRDDYSGLASGAIYYRLVGAADWRPLFTQTYPNDLRARVDSAAEAPGTYEFMATASDNAGNVSQTTLREDGRPMTLQFPLRSGVELNAHIEPGGSKRTTVAYGKSARVQGRLFDAAGQPLAGKPVVVDEDFGEGALIDHRIRTVVTDEAGRWSSRLPAGPTRSVSAEYAGDQRYLDTTAAAGRLAVKTGAKLGLTRRHVPEGRGTTFKGRIERLGARIPTRGKLLQIQYQDPTSGRWATVRNPFRTKSDGRFRFKYGFGTHYEQDVGIRFRLKVPSERGWPYRGTRTGARRVIVEAR